MLKQSIMLTSVKDAEEFVKKAARCDFNINVSKSQFHYMVDGKSILGMMTILGRDSLDVFFDGESSEFTQMLEKFQVV